MTLGEIMQSKFAREHSKHFALLRNPPYRLNFRPKINKKEPSKNLYTLRPVSVDEGGAEREKQGELSRNVVHPAQFG